MKKGHVAFIVALVSSGSWASHFVGCDVEAKVLKVDALARLGGETNFSTGTAPKLGPQSDYEETVTLRIQKVVKITGSSPACLSVGSEHTLYLDAKQRGTYKSGDTLSLQYQNIGDRTGSTITWNLSKP